MDDGGVYIIHMHTPRAHLAQIGTMPMHIALLCATTKSTSAALEPAGTAHARHPSPAFTATACGDHFVSPTPASGAGDSPRSASRSPFSMAPDPAP